MPSDTNCLLCNMPDKTDFFFGGGGEVSLHCVDVDNTAHIHIVQRPATESTSSMNLRESRKINKVHHVLVERTGSTRIQEILGLNTGPKTIYTD